jgi:hypothetical protein
MPCTSGYLNALSYWATRWLQFTAVVREQQATMTLVFGFFGSVNALLFLAYQIPRPTGKHVPWWALWWTPAVGSVVLASVATLALWTLLRALRERV